jgi:hypothetical protein
MGPVVSFRCVFDPMLLMPRMKEMSPAGKSGS